MSIRLLVPLVALSLGAAGCDSGVPEIPDGARMRDAAVADGGGLLDAGATLDAAAPFDAPFDAGGSALCMVATCDPRLPATGCAVGQCSLHAADASCETEAGSLSAGAECTAASDCAPGLACFLAEGRGVCGRVCCPADGEACVDEGATCGGSGVLIDGTETSWGRCLARRTCDVLEPERTCEAREGCYIVDRDGATECRVAGSGGPGDSCEVQEDCASGFFCGGFGPGKRCVRICRIGAGDCPTEEGRCVMQSQTPVGVGLCTLDSTSARWDG